MAYDEALAQRIRDALPGDPALTEKKMFGGLAFLVGGNMLCGVHSGGAMFRVGKENEAQALAIEGVRPMDFTGRRMGGFVDVADEAVVDEVRRARLMALGCAFVETLPAK